MKTPNSFWLCPLILLLVTASPLHSQVYVSNYYKGEIYVGPKNVLRLSPGIQTYYLEELQSAIDHLSEQVSLLEHLNTKMSKTKKEQRQANKLLSKQEVVINDFANLNALHSAWKNLDVSEYQEDTSYCHLAHLDTQQVDISTSVKKRVKNIEVIAVTSHGVTERWVKKKNTDYKSSNPDARFVWCLVPVTQIHFIDMDGQLLELTSVDTYHDFECKKNVKTIERPRNIKFQNEELVYMARSRGSKKIIPIATTFKCSR